jgi:hypothetical protein
MIDFSVFFKNHLSTGKVSDDNMNRFSQDSLQRLIANNPVGIYTPLIDATTPAYNNYFKALNTEAHSASVKEGATVSVDQLKQEFINLVSMKEGIIKGTWGKDSPQYQQFFPLGVEEYHKSTKANIQMLMARWITACEDFVSELPASFADPFIAIRTSYETARTQQLNHIGTTDGNKLATSNMRSILEVQLMKNLITVALNNIGNPDAVNVYFDQSIIRHPSRKKEEGEPEEETLTGAVEAESKATILHGGFDANTSFTLINSGSTALQFYTANMPEDAVPGTRVELQPGEEVETYASEMGAEGNLFLMVFNTSKDTAGSYEVMINEV